MENMKIKDVIDENEKLPFAYQEIVRLMKQNLSKDKQIRASVKKAMNEFLYKILTDICKEMDKHPYITLEKETFLEATFGYRNIKAIAQERKALLARLEAMEKDIQLMKSDIISKMKLVENDDWTDLNAEWE